MEEGWTAGWAGLGEARESVENGGPLVLTQPEGPWARQYSLGSAPLLQLAPSAEIHPKRQCWEWLLGGAGSPGWTGNRPLSLRRGTGPVFLT